jgi:hypothetical protein
MQRICELARLVGVREQANDFSSKGGAAPRAVLERDRRGVALGVALVGEHAGAGGGRAAVALRAELVRGGGLADPQADLEGPGAEALRVALALELEGADQRGGAAELIEGQEAQGVAHQHADAGAEQAGVTQAAQDQGEGGEAEVGLGLAAAGREEQEVDDAAIAVRGVDDAGRLSRMKASWNGRQRGRIDLLRALVVAVTGALAHGRGDGAVGQLEREEGVGIAGEGGQAGGDAVAGECSARCSRSSAGLLARGS